MPQVTIIDKQIEFKGKLQHVVINHFVDKNDEYTGKYLVVIGAASPVTIELNGDAIWEESNGKVTDVSRFAGEMIENYSE